MNSKLRKKLLSVFTKLRKQNIFTRVNFSCCQYCAINEMYKIIDDSKKDYIGYVFWTKQDEDKLKDPYDKDFLYLCFGKHESEIQFTTIDIGNKIILALVKEGIHCEWDGSPNTKIKIIIS